MLECASVLGGGKCNPIHSLFSLFFFFFLKGRATRHILHQHENSPFADTTERDEPFSNLNFEENRSKTNKTTPVWYRPAVQTMPSNETRILTTLPYTLSASVLQVDARLLCSQLQFSEIESS